MMACLIPLEPTYTVLLVIDVQNSLFTRPTPIDQAAQLLANINQLRAKSLESIETA